MSTQKKDLTPATALVVFSETIGGTFKLVQGSAPRVQSPDYATTLVTKIFLY